MKEIEQVLGRVRPGQASVDDVTVSMNAILVPSSDSIGDVSICPLSLSNPVTSRVFTW